jgi:hypothetical protein
LRDVAHGVGLSGLVSEVTGLGGGGLGGAAGLGKTFLSLCPDGDDPPVVFGVQPLTVGYAVADSLVRGLQLCGEPDELLLELLSTFSRSGRSPVGPGRGLVGVGEAGLGDRVGAFGSVLGGESPVALGVGVRAEPRGGHRHVLGLPGHLLRQTYTTGEGRMGITDWQMTMQGGWVFDAPLRARELGHTAAATRCARTHPRPAGRFSAVRAAGCA